LHKEHSKQLCAGFHLEFWEKYVKTREVLEEGQVWEGQSTNPRVIEITERFSHKGLAGSELPGSMVDKEGPELHELQL
jgi:hypothetical protein